MVQHFTLCRGAAYLVFAHLFKNTDNMRNLNLTFSRRWEGDFGALCRLKLDISTVTMEGALFKLV